MNVKEMAQSQFGDRSQYLLQYEDFAGQDFVEMQRENPLGQPLREELSVPYPEISDFTGYVNLHAAVIGAALGVTAFYNGWLG